MEPTAQAAAPADAGGGIELNTAAPAAAPPAAPVTPVDASITITTPAEAAPQAPQADAVVVYEPTGDAGLDLALEYVGQRGLGPDTEAMKAAMAGDFKPLAAALAALGDKGKDAAKYLKLAEESYGRQSAAAKDKTAAAEKVVHDTVGGVENWKQIKTWIQTEADPSEKAQINAAFKAGGLAAAAVARQLAEAYAKVKPAERGKSALKPEAASVSESAGPLSATEFAAESRKLNSKLGNRMEASPEYAALMARRESARRSEQRR